MTGPLKNSKLTPGRALVHCLCCGGDIIRNRKHLEREKGGPYCSISCRSKHLSAGRKNPNYRGGSITVHCATCGARFDRPANAASGNRYCSTACQHKALVGRPSPKRLLADRDCLICGSPFQPTRQTSKYCSRACKHEAQSRYVRGERSGTYVHGQSGSPYPRGWNAGLKGSIRRRDQFACRYCGMPQEVHPRALPVHHIDYNKSNLSQENLITLCDPCHGMMHGPKVRDGWPPILTDILKGQTFAAA